MDLANVAANSHRNNLIISRMGLQMEKFFSFRESEQVTQWTEYTNGRRT